MGIASFTPPGTLSVVDGWYNETKLSSWPSINWTLEGWVYEIFFLNPVASVFNIATQTATEMRVISLEPPSLNSSVRMSFFGPSLQCNIANESQQIIFDDYAWSLAETDFYRKMTEKIWVLGNFDYRKYGMSNLLIWSAFAPNLTPRFIDNFTYHGWYNNLVWVQNPFEVPQNYLDLYNNWVLTLPGGFLNLTQFDYPNPVSSVEYNPLLSGTNLNDSAMITTQQL